MIALDTGTVVGRFGYDVTDRPTMIYGLPSAPAVIDLDSDGFSDVVYIGDMGGQMWKWDISDVGEDTAGDADIDNWDSGIFFETPSVTLASGDPHFRSFFYPPAASYYRGKLILAFGSGERQQLLYEGDTTVADENRFYVMTDRNPIGASAFPGALDESDLTDVTALDFDNNLSDSGYYFDAAEGEKFVTDITIFAGHAIVGSYVPTAAATTCDAPNGEAYLHIFDLGTGQGFFVDPFDPPSEQRRTYVSGGLPSAPTVIVGDGRDDDYIFVKSSDGPKVFTFDAPPRDDPEASYIYWREEN